MLKRASLSPKSTDADIQGTLRDVGDHYQLQCCIAPTEGGTRENQFRDCLSQVRDLLAGASKTLSDAGAPVSEDRILAENIVSQRIFFKPGRDYREDVAGFTRQMVESGVYGSDILQPTAFIPQPPMEGDVNVFLDARFPKKGHAFSVEYARSPKAGLPVAILRHGSETDYHVVQTVLSGDNPYDTEGGPSLAERAQHTHEAYAVFERDILVPYNLTYSNIVCSRNYVGDILREEVTPDGRKLQCYQVVLNQPRREHYGPPESLAYGVPTATGIGVNGFNGIIFLVSLSDYPSTSVSNPEQTDAFSYGADVLVGDSLPSQVPAVEAPGASIKLPPMFARAKISGRRFIFAGTASIRQSGSLYQEEGFKLPAWVEVGNLASMTGGAEGLSRLFGAENVSTAGGRIRLKADSADVAQTYVTLDNMSALYRPENLAQYGIHADSSLADVTHLIAYSKRWEDADRIMRVHRLLFPGTPIIGVVCDVCRPELLPETEGEAVLSSSPRP